MSGETLWVEVVTGVPRTYNGWVVSQYKLDKVMVEKPESVWGMKGEGGGTRKRTTNTRNRYLEPLNSSSCSSALVAIRATTLKINVGMI